MLILYFENSTYLRHRESCQCFACDWPVGAGSGSQKIDPRTSLVTRTLKLFKASSHRPTGDVSWALCSEVSSMQSPRVEWTYPSKVQRCQTVTFKSLQCHPGLTYIFNF